MAHEDNSVTSSSSVPALPSNSGPAVREASRPVPTAGPPDWQHRAEDVFCPLCEYNLRGLIEPRCPECGHRFDWPDVLAPIGRRHPYLFEHHPAENLRSFRQTVVGGLRPRRFWSSLHPAQPSSPRRLVLFYGLLAAAVFTAFLILWVAVVLGGLEAHAKARAITVAQYQQPEMARGRVWVLQTHGSVEAYAAKLYPAGFVAVAPQVIRSRYLLDSLVWPLVEVLLWPWLTLLGLLLCHRFVRKPGINAIHVLRCAIYSADVLFWLGVLVVVTSPVFAGIVALYGTGKIRDLLSLIPQIGLPLLVLAGSWRLYAACRHYLRVEWPLGFVLVTQGLIAAIFVGVIVAKSRWL